MQVIAQDVPASEVDPEFYLSYTDKALLSKSSLSRCCFLTYWGKLMKRKATGLNMIASKLLKMAASIVAPTLTAIVTKSIITAIYPTEWKTARVTTVF